MGGSDIAVSSSESSETGRTLEDIFEGRMMLDAGVEPLEGSMLILVLLGTGTSEVIEVELTFRLSVGLTILDDGS
jgi:hypothetical protein